MDASPRLVLISEAELTEDPHPDQPFRLELDGWWEGSPGDGYSSTRLSVRFDSADLTALLAQGRASQLALVSRISRTGAGLQSLAELKEQAAIAARPAPRPDVALLERVFVKLHEI
ncbi:hypothetical protein [Streptomyces sp. MMBL 11-1]|uniref:hypothetical protein n=1 Tax=Streptomyces sp. MMBL 11-1 TaxID=3026420 RepID=UPI002362478E|nr:hypothetical protein [Streptomyces sp. MMBL 11-1]